MVSKPLINILHYVFGDGGEGYKFLFKDVSMEREIEESGRYFSSSLFLQGLGCSMLSLSVYTQLTLISLV